MTRALTAEQVMTMSEAAAFLRLSIPTVRKCVENEGLRGRKVGKEWRFLKSNLVEWLNANQKTA